MSDKIYGLQSQITDLSIDLTNTLRADRDHGPGFDTKEYRDEYIEYIGKKINHLKAKFDALTQELNKV